MAWDITSNLSSATVATGGSDAPASGTSEVFTVTNAINIPSITASVTQFRLVDAAQASNPSEAEVMTCTAVNGASWSIIRGTENIGGNGTTPVAHAPNWVAIVVTTEGTLANILQNQSLSVNAASVGASVIIPAPNAAPNYYNANFFTLTQSSASIQLPSAYVGLDTLVSIYQGATGGFSYAFTTSGGGHQSQPLGSGTAASWCDNYRIRSYDGTNVFVTLVEGNVLGSVVVDSKNVLTVDLAKNTSQFASAAWLSLVNPADNTEAGLIIDYYQYDGATRMRFAPNDWGNGIGSVIEFAPAENILIFGGVYGSGSYPVSTYLDGATVFHFGELVATDGQAWVNVNGTTAGFFSWHMPFGGTGYKKLLITFSGYENDTGTSQVYNLTTGGYGSNYIQSFSNAPNAVFNNTGLLVSLSANTITIQTPDSTQTYTGAVTFEGY